MPETPAPSNEHGSAARGRRADLDFAGNEAAGTVGPCAPYLVGAAPRLVGAPRVGLPESVTSFSEPCSPTNVPDSLNIPFSAQES